jgi:hypothetical protein
MQPPNFQEGIEMKIRSGHIGIIALLCCVSMLAAVSCATSGGADDGGISDTGTDGGVYDGGPGDSGVKDAGTDGGINDSGLGDSGVQDTGTDGGISDGGSGDSGISDSGTDGGISDGGSHSPIDTRLPAPVHVAIDLHYDLVFGLDLSCASNVTWNAVIDGTSLDSGDVACYDYSYSRPYAIRFDDASLTAFYRYYLTAYGMVDGSEKYEANCWADTASAGEAVLPTCSVKAL